MEEIINQVITTGVGMAILGGAYCLDLLFGFLRVSKMPDVQWSWAKFRHGLLRAIALIVGVLGFVVILNLTIWYAPLVGADLGFLNGLTLSTIIIAILGGTAWYLWSVAENIQKIFNSQGVAAEIDETSADYSAIANKIKEVWAEAITPKPAEVEIFDIPSELGNDGDALEILKGTVGQYLIEGVSGQARGQCSQVPNKFRMLCGLPSLAMGNGRDIVDNMVKAGLAEYCGAEAGAIWSTKHSKNGHTGVMLDSDYLIEQNVNISGLPARDFGWGNTYPVRIGRLSETWRNKTGLVFCRLKAYKPAPEPSPFPEPQPTPPTPPTPSDEVKIGYKVRTTATHDAMNGKKLAKKINDGQSVYQSKNSKGFAVLARGGIVVCAVPIDSLVKA
jgi:hypothetical protein